MDLTQLRGLVAAPGPFVSVYLDGAEPHWADVRATLAEQGADARTLSSVDRALTESPGGSGRVLVASAGEVLLDRRLPEPPAQPLARWSALPYLMPLLERTEADLPHVVVFGDEVLGFDSDGILVEKTKQDNAIALAESADRMARRLSARLLVLSGEVQARTAVRMALPENSAAIAEELPEAGWSTVDGAVRKLIAQRADALGHNAVDRFRVELARGGDVARGLRAVVSALREGRVDTVLLDGAATADRTIWIGSEPTQIAVDEAELRALGVPRLARERADSALVMAAVATGAMLHLVTGDPDLADGAGALLRL
ncbi:Vms1/Ankzf1 family peptidyl-tRNA hydrolase [Allokutzneria multivorans]|uniref:Vms1/Ankzf1 family peptidyl-tRNA hydrolase n=1 Tax=Allokutzneria multivorans TaxID=1142134 RepID=A0ABP7S6U7_9PSEU